MSLIICSRTNFQPCWFQNYFIMNSFIKWSVYLLGTVMACFDLIWLQGSLISMYMWIHQWNVTIFVLKKCLLFGMSFYTRNEAISWEFLLIWVVLSFTCDIYINTSVASWSLWIRIKFYSKCLYSLCISSITRPSTI